MLGVGEAGTVVVAVLPATDDAAVLDLNTAISDTVPKLLPVTNNQRSAHMRVIRGSLCMVLRSCIYSACSMQKGE